MSVDIPDEVMAEVRQTREYRAGSGFDVPGVAVEGFCQGILAAAYPVLERQVRVKIAREIEASITEWDGMSDYAFAQNVGLRSAARIARGGQDG